MLGGSSIRLTTIFGIRIGVNVSWFFVLFLFIYLLNDQFESRLGNSTQAFWTAVAAAFAFFGSVLLHELGHALVARRDGIGVACIDLFFFGGVMKMSSDTRSPGQEFRIAIAGPLVTAGIIVVAALCSTALLGWQGFVDSALLRDNVTPSPFDLWLSFLVTMNIFLLGFNLVPAFPLDGGRVARSIVWKVTGDRNRATRMSAYLGQGFAGLLMVYGGYLLLSRNSTTNGLWLIVLGYLLGSSARAAIAQSAFTERLKGITVADVMDAEPVAIPADLPAIKAWDEYFQRYYGSSWIATVEPDGRYAGLAHRAAVEHAALTEGGAMPVRDVVSDGEDRVRWDEPLEALLASEPLRRLGALIAVDAEGRLRGVITVEQVTRALQSRLHPA